MIRSDLSLYEGTRRLIKSCRPAVSLYHSLGQGLIAFLYALSPVLLAKVRYRMAWGRWPDLRRPRLFDEKLLWLMLYWRHPLKATCGDKFALRGYVEQAGLGHLLPHLYGVYQRAADINFEVLPKRFVLKCSHSCKSNIFCADKSDLDYAATRATLDRWLSVDYSKVKGEIHYADMTPRIICEEYLDQPARQLPDDYKAHCFGGRVHCTMTCVDRTPNGTAKLAFYDRDWRQRLMYERSEFSACRDIRMPAGYSEMLSAAEILGKPFPFVRVDFYCISTRVVLGELTFTPGACISADYLTQISQEEMGQAIALPATSIPLFRNP
jgi:hypothetical protein